MKIAVFGGTGRTGKLIVKRALSEGLEVVALVRTPEKMAIQDEKLTVIEGDVTDKTTVTQAITGADAVISALSPTLRGMQNIIEVMQSLGVGRLVVTMGAGVYRTGDEPPFSSKVISWLIRTFSKEAFEESTAIADAVQGSGLDWTLARAPRLADKPATDKLYVGPLTKEMKTSLSREDYANFMVSAITDESLVGKAPVLSDR